MALAAEKKWLLTLFSAAFLSLLVFLSAISGFSSDISFSSAVQHGTPYPPTFAYYIFGGRGHKDRIMRLLLAVYHPRNRYLLHLGPDASNEDRSKLALAVRAVPAIRAFGNVDVVGKPDPGTYMGSSNVAATLRAAALLLKVDSGWDWFITLSAMDYPLLTQDDVLIVEGAFSLTRLKRCAVRIWALLCLWVGSGLSMGLGVGSDVDAVPDLSRAYMSHVFSSVRKDLNFIDHTSDLGWKEHQRVQPIVVDPGIYLARRTQIFHATEKRPTPETFKFFTGSPWFILSKSFLEFCVLGWDNLPRTLLMYFTNVLLSQEGYFHSVICNSPEFQNTTVNSDLRFMVWDNPPKMEPLHLNVSDYNQMVHSGAAFARQFQNDDPVLDLIDEKILQRGLNKVTPGAWCTGQRSWWMDPCSKWGDVNIVKPGPQADRFKDSITNLLSDWNDDTTSCK
ncbi:hypothetical protein GIB67_025630 [Kingdonia uniflora]|uniref:Uncharacterized protein n=1 Tax=Kingdonia uniflora TaxID=39325 RepID=A0A7J7L8E1_9MAGN|nr:hypothetical protein GIB67_025630 [Kingdonia uniflora]